MAAEALGSAVAGEVVSQAVSSFSDWYERGTDSDEKLKKMEMNLLKIRSVIEMAERKHISNRFSISLISFYRSLCEWLKEIKQDAEEGETMLNKFKTQALNHDGFNKQGVFTSVMRFISSKKNVTTRQLTDLCEQIEKLSLYTDDFVKLLELEKCWPKIPCFISWPDSSEGFQKNMKFNFSMRLKSGDREMKLIPIYELKHEEKTLFVVNLFCNKQRFWDEFSLETRISWCEFSKFCANGAADFASKLAQNFQNHMKELESRGSRC